MRGTTPRKGHVNERKLNTVALARTDGTAADQRFTSQRDRDHEEAHNHWHKHDHWVFGINILMNGATRFQA